MNVIKNMEAIFLAAAVLAGASAYAGAAIPQARAARAAQVSVEGDARIAVVKVSAKRLSAAEKARAAYAAAQS